jgi:hemolysin activation/secretion protein
MTYDIGTQGQDARRSGSSVGLGLRFGLTDTVSGQLELAKPMTRPVALEDNGKAARIFFRLSARF